MTGARPGSVRVKLVLLLALAILLFARQGHAAQSYAARGLVLKVDKPHRSLLVSCERIPDYMGAMVMPFSVRDSAELNGLDAGTMIEFTVVVDQTSSYIKAIRIHHYESVEADPLGARRLKLMASLADPSSEQPEIKIGDSVPDFSLIDQNHQDVSLSQFRGKVVALTFTYTHCVLPNFCFRIANNFRQLQKRFEDQLGRNLIFMTITFDPAHDTPEVMAKYGETWNADSKGWRLLTGSPSAIEKVSGQFGVGYWADEGVMIHSLHTVIVNRDGTLAANLEGNEFSANELGDLVQTVLVRPPKRPVRAGQVVPEVCVAS
jgi:protein SCO1/2